MSCEIIRERLLPLNSVGKRVIIYSIEYDSDSDDEDIELWEFHIPHVFFTRIDGGFSYFVL